MKLRLLILYKLKYPALLRWNGRSFYGSIFDFKMSMDQGWTKIDRVPSLVFNDPADEKKGIYSFTEEKDVIVSFIIDEIKGLPKDTQHYFPFELRLKKWKSVKDVNTMPLSVMIRRDIA